ncbi:hypothetical protein PHLCEN_2v4324 [Hermanssonia centrifuga]|uniref:Uncharacterized protein n=1 Tax=Hermanssonia centrifuga TaxID=98765 RepID=A0A2R6PVJ3_9APHY|nr:hypothetical protein PHLCEN_2v4324 [Hermanssonia centrifuga]
MPSQVAKWEKWVSDAIIILLSFHDVPRPLSEVARKALRSCMDCSAEETLTIIASCHWPKDIPESLSHIFEILSDSFKLLDGEAVEHCISAVVQNHPGFCDDDSDHVRYHDLADILRIHSKQFPNNIIAPLILRHVVKHDSEQHQSPSGMLSTDIATVVRAVGDSDDFLEACLRNLSHNKLKDPSIIIKFTMQIIRNRAPEHMSSDSPSDIPKLDTISSAAWKAISDNIALVLIRKMEERKEESIAWEEWMKDAISIIIGFCDFPLPSRAEHALQLCMAIEPIVTSETIGMRNKLADVRQGLSHIFGRLQPSLTRLKPEFILRSIFTVLQTTSGLCNDNCKHGFPNLQELLRSHAQILPDVLPRVLMEQICRAYPWRGDPNHDTMSFYVQLISAAGVTDPDDKFLRVVVPDVLEQCKDKPTESMRLLLTLIQSCQKRNIPLSGLKHIINLRNVSIHVWEAIMNGAADILSGVTREGNDKQEQWAKDALIVLFSISYHRVPTKANSVLRRCIRSLNDWEFILEAMLSLKAIPMHLVCRRYLNVFERIRRVSSLRPRFNDVAQYCITFIKRDVCKPGCKHGSQLGDILSAHLLHTSCHRVVHLLVVSAKLDDISLSEIGHASILAEVLYAICSVISAPDWFASDWDRDLLAFSRSIFMATYFECAIAGVPILHYIYINLNLNGKTNVL